MLTTQHLQQLLTQHKAQLLQKYPLTKMAIFGSYARGEQHMNSDIDLLVEFNQPIGIRFIDLATDLEKILQKKVDLVCNKDLRPQFLATIQPDLQYVLVHKS
ncbi:MAG: hypothetical protein RIQ33_763 [Bacteroidota bacterium]|jgi:predicted nucleotidyltransferase